MLKKPTLAIYSGEIPSTTFIERLIEGLAQKDYEIHLFGIRTKTPLYKGTVWNHGYTNSPFFKGFYLLKYWFLLTFFKSKEKKRLDLYLKAQGRWTAYNRVKAYPVLWYQPDIFHVQWAKGIDDWVWVQSFGMKLVLSLRGAHINYSPIANPELAQMYRNNFPKIDGFHAVSKAIKQKAQNYGADSDKIEVVYSGLDLGTITNYKKKRSHVFDMISVGRPHWKKGYHYALDCCSILKKQGLKFRYIIIGAENSLELQYQVRDLGLDDCVSLMSNLAFNDVKHRMELTNLLLLPSVEEGIANVALEAMSVGTLVLSTDCGGMTEVIKNGVNGYIVPVRQPRLMAERILEISQLSQKEYEHLAKNARKTIHEQHSIEQMIKCMETFYLEIIDK